YNLSLADGCYRNFDLDVAVSAPPLASIAIAGSGAHTLQSMTIPERIALSASGSGSLIARGLIEAPDRIDVDVDGASLIELSLETSDLNILLSGSGTIRATGQAEGQLVDISGSGRYLAFGLTSTSATVTLSGSAVAEVSASERLDATISGSAILSYRGQPIISSSIDGSGAIVDAN
ncbi:MAG: DUF2807 domain-containing protein, partial [Myxococcota bacterium]